MKYLTSIQTVLIIILFGIILFRENSFEKSQIIQRKSDSTYFSCKDSIYYSNVIDSLDNELFIKTIDVGRYEAAIDGMDDKCKEQLQSHLVE